MVKKNQIKEVAWISDLHIGTVFYNPKIMEGVGKILSSRQDLSAVIIDGGLIPRVPSHFGRMNAQYFEILDQDIGAKYGKAVEEKVKKLHELKAGIEEEGKARVDSLDELIEVVQPEIKKMNLPAGDIVYYAWGEEDYSNVQDLIDTKIREYIVFKDSKADEIKEQLERSEETRKAKYEEITTKRKEVSKLKQQMKKGGDEKELEKANAEIQKLTGELEHLNIAYDSFKKHLANLESEKDAYSRGIRSFTKTWQLSPSEYSNPKKTGVKNRALKAYKELLYPMFKGKHLRLISHLEEIVNIDGLSLNISHNRNAISSNSILPSSLKNRVSQTKMKNRRGEKVADIDAEAHHGGFKIYAQKRSSDSNDTIYFLQVPPLQDPREVKKARERWVKTWDTKRYYDPFASGLTLTRKREDGVLEVEFYSSELLEKIATNGKLSLGKNVKIEIISDMHIGAPNERGYMTNYQMIEAIKKYQESRLPDIVVVGGDAINGEHLDQII
ncbi:hypothetical protein HZA33_05365, partial [Candidatus Pacearchaeota archaeon]|nr:hypothetical protein [Candidatus Pacearchaeota archaeon]